MSVSSFLVAIGTIAVTMMACAGVLFIIGHGWRGFTKWIARHHINNERRRANSAFVRQQQISAQREEAILHGATTVARDMLHTLVDVQLRHLAVREREHRQQIVQLFDSVADTRLVPSTSDISCADSVHSAEISIPRIAAIVPRRNGGILTSIGRRLLGVPVSSVSDDHA
jgi:hypothetical protein